MIALFAYDFPHRKTQDFIIELKTHGVDCFVIAAPFQSLKEAGGAAFHRSLQAPLPLSTEELCNRFGLKYARVGHDEVGHIESIVAENQIKMGLIAGARIIKSNIIDLFSEGVFNLHPGPIPQTSGLDSFFYSIKNSCPMGVTGHFIDPKVDAGEFVFFEELKVGASDSLEIVSENLYRLQLSALRTFISGVESGFSERAPIIRPKKNEPMPLDEKRKMVELFPVWRAERYIAQSFSTLVESCRVGDIGRIINLLGCLPSLLEMRNEKGWTPLIVAAFNGHADIVQYLLELGANPNATGFKGTTVLMYAKTRLLNAEDASYKILHTLIESGADLDRCDCFGHDVLHYVYEAGDQRLAAYLIGFKERFDGIH